MLLAPYLATKSSYFDDVGVEVVVAAVEIVEDDAVDTPVDGVVVGADMLGAGLPLLSSLALKLIVSKI